MAVCRVSRRRVRLSCFVDSRSGLRSTTPSHKSNVECVDAVFDFVLLTYPTSVSFSTVSTRKPRFFSCRTSGSTPPSTQLDLVILVRCYAPLPHRRNGAWRSWTPPSSELYLRISTRIMFNILIEYEELLLRRRGLQLCCLEGSNRFYSVPLTHLRSTFSRPMKRSCTSALSSTLVLWLCS